MPGPESLLCLPRPAIMKLVGDRRGFIAASWLGLVSLGHLAESKPRCLDLEEPGGTLFPEWVQLVSYCVVGLAGSNPPGSPWPGRCWAYQRAGGGEQRLEAELSIGIGGHVRATDGTNPAISQDPAPLDRAILGAVARELSEEMALKLAGAPKFMGLIFRDDRPVEAAHLGVVFLVTVGAPSDANARPGEGLIGMGWYEQTTLLVARRHFEPWSMSLIEAMPPRPQAAVGA